MAFLSGTRAWREAAATLWLMVLGAGLLATSPPEDSASPNVLWSGMGPLVTLSDAAPRQDFAVTLLVPKAAAAPELARVTLSVTAEHVGASTAGGPGGQAGAGPVEGNRSPWITLAMHDTSGVTLTESTPFLSTWSGGANVTFSGDCEAPDPAATDPCRLSFVVAFERSPSGSAAETELTWSAHFSANVSGAEPGTDVGWAVEIERL